MKLLLAVLVLTATCASIRAIAADYDAAVATNQVGIELYRELAAQQPDGNLVLSPYSIQSALALVYAGSDGKTRTEMARVLRFSAGDAALQAGTSALSQALEQMAAKTRAASEAVGRNGGRLDSIEWHAANRLYGQSGYAFRESYLKLMNDGFGAPFQAVNFRNEAEAARANINTWVEEQTRRKIRDLVPRGALNADTRLVLVNALYLKAPWGKPFPKTATQLQSFRRGGGATMTVPTMNLVSPVAYAMEQNLTVVALNYTGGDLQFLILLPAEGHDLKDLSEKLTAEHFRRWAQLGGQKKQSVSLYLPKFRVEGSTVPLGKTLQSLGVRSAFDIPMGSANFDRIAPRQTDEYLKLSEVFHQTFIALDEEGTEAAAATAATMELAASAADPAKPIEIRIDRPFLFAIQHRPSGACLFLGRIADPR